MNAVWYNKTMRQVPCGDGYSAWLAAQDDGALCVARVSAVPGRFSRRGHLSGRRRTGLQWLVCLLLGGLLAVGGPATVLAKGSPSLRALKSAYASDQSHSQALAGQIQTLAGRETDVSQQIYLTERKLSRLRTQQLRAEALQTRAAAAVLADRATARRDDRVAQVARRQLRGQLIFWYEQGDAPFLQVLFQAKNFSDLLYRVVAMHALVLRQQELMRQDVAALRAARLVAKKAVREELLAVSAKRRVQSLGQAVSSQQAAEEQLMARVAAQKNATAFMRAGTITAMQRLASEISVVEQAQARAAAAARLAAEQKAQAAAQPSAAGSPSAAAPLPAAILQNSQVRQDLTDAARLTGVASSWVPWLEIIANYESGGNPSAVSPIAVDGEHATGLMQMLPDTFQRYALSGYNDIWNPTDNAAAAIRYIEANYGAPWRIPGIGSQSTYRGY